MKESSGEEVMVGAREYWCIYEGIDIYLLVKSSAIAIAIGDIN